jgi:lipopolysaccharide/colanic/teichoic acid biosynthesis glycosyltransferase
MRRPEPQGVAWLRSPAKRRMDVVLAQPLLIVATPLLAGARLAIRSIDGVSPDFSQSRKGRDGSDFIIRKLRTMPDTHEDTISQGKHDRRELVRSLITPRRGYGIER